MEHRFSLISSFITLSFINIPLVNASLVGLLNNETFEGNYIRLKVYMFKIYALGRLENGISRIVIAYLLSL